MSLRPDGSYRCDSCGGDIDNAGPHMAVAISGLDPDSDGLPWRLHLCLVRDLPHGKHAPGCRDSVLTKQALADYYAQKD